jgi:hypothetical protein
MGLVRASGPAWLLLLAPLAVAPSLGDRSVSKRLARCCTRALDAVLLLLSAVVCRQPLHLQVQGQRLENDTRDGDEMRIMRMGRE